MTTEKSSGVAAVDRALMILMAFDGETKSLTISELSRRTGLYKSTALRLIQSLKAQGFIMQLSNKSYQLGPALIRLGRAYQMSGHLGEHIRPFMEQLVRQGSESSCYYVKAGAESRLCVLRVDSLHSTLDRVKEGTMLPLDRGAAGRVFLAYDSRERGDVYEHVRQSGYAVSFGETDPDCAAVAAPVINANKELIGVLSLSGPKTRFNQDTAQVQINLLLPAVEELNRIFGGAAAI